MSSYDWDKHDSELEESGYWEGSEPTNNVLEVAFYTIGAALIILCAVTVYCISLGG